MPFDLSIVGQQSEPDIHTYAWKDAVLYALGVGAKQGELDYLYEGRGPKVLPSFAVVPSYKPVIALLGRTGGSYANVVHGAQRVVLRKPLASEGVLSTIARLKGSTICAGSRSLTSRPRRTTRPASGSSTRSGPSSFAVRGASVAARRRASRQHRRPEGPPRRLPDRGSDEQGASAPLPALGRPEPPSMPTPTLPRASGSSRADPPRALHLRAHGAARRARSVRRGRRENHRVRRRVQAPRVAGRHPRDRGVDGRPRQDRPVGERERAFRGSHRQRVGYDCGLSAPGAHYPSPRPRLPERLHGQAFPIDRHRRRQAHRVRRHARGAQVAERDRPRRPRRQSCPRAVEGRPREHRARRHRQRHADERRCDLLRAPRRPQGRAPDHDPRRHREPPLRLRFRSDHPGGVAAPPRRGGRRPRRRHREHDPGAAHPSRRAGRLAVRQVACGRGLALVGADGQLLQHADGG